MNLPPAIPKLLLAIAGAVSLALAPMAAAIDAGDMDPHLPDDAILATMRFRAFTRKSDDKAEWEKKHAELQSLLKEELDQATLIDNRAATALRTLISDLEDARFTPRKNAEAKPVRKFPVLADGNLVMVNQRFQINSPETRVLTYPFEIARVPAMITVGIGGGSDDSGDRGLHYILIDPVGRVIKRGFADVDEFVWEEHLSTRAGKWKVIIEDLDTDLDDKRSPGNRGAIEILVNPE